MPYLMPIPFDYIRQNRGDRVTHSVALGTGIVIIGFPKITLAILNSYSNRLLVERDAKPPLKRQDFPLPIRSNLKHRNAIPIHGKHFYISLVDFLRHTRTNHPKVSQCRRMSQPSRDRHRPACFSVCLSHS